MSSVLFYDSMEMAEMLLLKKYVSVKSNGKHSKYVYMCV